jgi:hypothetical protein
MHGDLIKQFTIISSLMGGAKAHSVHLHSTTKPNTESEFFLNLEIFNKLISRQTFFLELTVVCMIIVIVLNIYCMYWKHKRHSYIYIEFKTAKETYLVSYKTLPDANRCFQIITRVQPMKLSLINCALFAVIKFEGLLWIIEDTRTSHKIDLPRYKLLGWRDSRKVKLLLDDQTLKIRPIWVHSHEYITG